MEIRPKLAGWLMLLLALGLASGCADTAGIKPQAHLLDASKLATTIPVGLGDAQWPRAQWWQAYGDVQLDALIATALNDNPSLRAAEARVRQAQFVAGMAESATLPQVGLSSSLTRQLFSQHDFIPAPQAGNYDWYNRVAVEASYDLDLWGRNRQQLAASVDEVHVAEAESQMARLALENLIVRSYVQLALNYTLKDLVADTLQRRRKALDITRRRVAIGLATEVETSQLEAVLPALQARIEAYDETIILIKRQLVVLSGQGPGAADSLQRPSLQLGDDTNWMRLPSSLPAELIGRRPDVAARRWGVEASAREIEVANAAFYPNINLAAFMGFQALGFAKFLNNESSIRGYGPAISLPIFEGGRLRASFGAQTSAYDVAVESYNETLLHALQSVADALTVAASQRQQKQLIETGVATARRANQLAHKGFAAGITDYLTVLNSEITLLAEQEQEAMISARQIESHAGLMLALGGGLPPTSGPDEARIDTRTQD